MTQMPSIHLPKGKGTTTLRDVISRYLPSAEQASPKTHAGVLYMRNLAKRILADNTDIADREFDDGQELIVSRKIFDFINDDFTKALNEAEASKEQITEADIVRRIPDEIAHALSQELRKRVEQLTQ